MRSGPDAIPLWVKLAYTAWVVVWVPIYWAHYTPLNFLWLCDAAILVTLVALWRESRLLLSSQAAGVVLVQIVWGIDYVGRLALGAHPIGGTEYMFDEALPLWLRMISLYHLVMPVFLVWGVSRLGYDRRGWWLQSALAALLLPASYLFGTAEENVNWVYEPFGFPQTLLPPTLYLALCIAAYPLLVFLPGHAAMLALARRVGWKIS